MALDGAGAACHRDADRYLRLGILRQLTRDRSRPPTWATVLITVVVVNTVLLGLFCVLEDYAGTIGRRNVELVAQRVMTLPRASAVSPAALHIEADGVTEEELEDGAFKTTGLRLLARSGGKIILLQDGWSPDRDGDRGGRFRRIHMAVPAIVAATLYRIR